MATTAYSEGTYTEHDIKFGSGSPAALRSSKRKRETADSPSTPSRGGPNARRSSSQQYAAQVEDPNNAFNDTHGSGGFDLSALQAHQTTQQPPSTSHIAQQANMGSHPAGTPNMDTAAAALSYTMNVPPPPAENFINQPTTNMGNSDQSADFSSLQQADPSPNTPGDPHATNSPTLDSPTAVTPLGGKPAVGSAEWNKVRKDNHKEVERRRRETINEGINELAKIVPGCEKNKGSILARAVQYIQKLQDDAQANIDKWTFEKLVTEQAIRDLSGKLDRISKERDAWMDVSRENGVDVESVRLKIDEEDVAGAGAGTEHQGLEAGQVGEGGEAEQGQTGA